MSSQINLDQLPSYCDPYAIEIELEVVKVLRQLYGRTVAHRYFTKHFCFDKIDITVK